MLNRAPLMDKTGLPDTDEEGKAIEIPSSSGQGLYRMVYMVYAPESSKGRGVIQVDLPNKREYRRVKWQLKRKCKMIRFKNAYDEPQLVHAHSPNMISITVEKYVVKPARPGEKPKIILPTADAISNIR
jgi:hypothetical protein